MKKLLALLLVSLVTITPNFANAKPWKRVTPRCAPGCPEPYGPYNSTSDAALIPLTASTDGTVKEYHGTGPALNLLMNDSRLQRTKFYGQVGRTNSNWNIVATTAGTGPTQAVVSFTLTSQTFWTTVAQDGTWLHRNGYFVEFRRRGASLAQANLSNFPFGTGGDICGRTSQPYFSRIPIPIDVYNNMDSVLITAKADQMWACQ